jgi:hypothetical protein
VSEVALFLTASLAQRARIIEGGGRIAPSAATYLDDLVARLAAALLA